MFESRCRKTLGFGIHKAYTETTPFFSKPHIVHGTSGSYTTMCNLRNQAGALFKHEKQNIGTYNSLVKSINDMPIEQTMEQTCCKLGRVTHAVLIGCRWLPIASAVVCIVSYVRPLRFVYVHTCMYRYTYYFAKASLFP